MVADTQQSSAHAAHFTSAVYSTGIRGANDLVWVGRAANYAAKLSARSGPATQITSDVYDRLDHQSKFGPKGENMWVQQTAREIGGARIYTSAWYWGV